MHLVLRIALFSCLAAVPLAARSQAGKSVAAADSSSLPDAPEPSRALDASVDTESSAQDSSSAAAQQSTTGDRHKQTDEQLNQEEHQRVAGVMSTFNTTSNRNAAPLSRKQKFELYFRSEVDPWAFALAGAIAAIGQASNSYPEWGQGMQGYGKRYGAAYGDALIGNFFGNALMPSLLKEDPRYFQMGTGSRLKRFLWAATSTVWCRRDKGGWGPNYANVGGNLIGAAISRAYYPDPERDLGSTIGDGLRVSAEGIIGSEVIEFWPDIARLFKKKHDTTRKSAGSHSIEERE